jgi:hypothetical protein
MRPWAASWLTRAVTAVRDSPVRRPISDRLFAWPDRISWSTWPAVAGRLIADGPAGATWRFIPLK